MKKLWEKLKALFDLNHDGKVSAEDAVLAKAIAEAKLKKANEAINQVRAEVKDRVARVKEEIQDVKEAAAEVVDQAEDVVAAAKGKKRAGRKKK